MRARMIVLLAAFPIAACMAAHEPPSSAAVQQPVESACAPGTRTLGEVGLVARTEFSGEAQAKITVTNAGSARHRVTPRKVALCDGACGARYARCRDQRNFEAAERARYDVALAAGESIELLVDARNAEPTYACTKAGLVLLLAVDGNTACTDAGTWILVGQPDQG